MNETPPVSPPDQDIGGELSRLDRLAAVVVTFFPDDGVLERLESIASQVACVVVVDNGSSLEVRNRLSQWIGAHGGIWISNGQNLGLSVALNRGFEQAHATGFKWVVTFDQDSCPEQGFTDALTTTLVRHPRRGCVAMIGAHVFEPALRGRAACWLIQNPRCRWAFARVSCSGRDLEDVTMVITSGCLTRVEAWRQLSGFDEELFIDFVDSDFCLRAREAGWITAVSANARLRHALGARSIVHLAGIEFRPTHHSPLRRYYIARNRIRMMKRHGVRAPDWLAFELCYVSYNSLRVLLTERQKRKKLMAGIWGTWHGLRGRFGPVSENVERRLR